MDPETIMRRLGAELRAKKKEMGVSQHVFCKRMLEAAGRSTKSINAATRWLRGEAMPKGDVDQKLAQWLGYRDVENMVSLPPTVLVKKMLGEQDAREDWPAEASVPAVIPPRKGCRLNLKQTTPGRVEIEMDARLVGRIELAAEDALALVAMAVKR